MDSLDNSNIEESLSHEEERIFGHHGVGSPRHPLRFCFSAIRPDIEQQ